MHDSCGTCCFALHYKGTFSRFLCKIGTSQGRADMRMKFKNILLDLLWDSKMLHLQNRYYDKIFTLLVHCKPKLFLMFLKWHTTIKVNCNLLQSFPLYNFTTVFRENMDYKLYQKIYFFSQGAGHFWGWPHAAVLVRHAGFCNSNLVVGFLKVTACF